MISRETNRILKLQSYSRLVAEIMKIMFPTIQRNKTVTDLKSNHIKHHRFRIAEGTCFFINNAPTPWLHLALFTWNCYHSFRGEGNLCVFFFSFLPNQFREKKRGKKTHLEFKVVSAVVKNEFFWSPLKNPKIRSSHKQKTTIPFPHPHPPEKAPSLGHWNTVKPEIKILRMFADFF